jgi:hypothetical protein
VEQSAEWVLAGDTEVHGEKPAPVSLCTPQMPYDLTWDWTLAAAVESRRLTAWTVAETNPL